MSVTPLNIEGQDRANPDRRHWRRRNQERPNPVVLRVAEMLIPILLAWGVAHLTAANAVQTEVAVIKAVQQSQFEEIQRYLKRFDDWIARQDSR